MATDAKIWVAGTDQYLEGVAVTTPAGDDLFREGVVISDPDAAAGRVKVTNAVPGSTDYGMVVRIAGPVDSVTGAVQGIEWEHSRIHDGRAFLAARKFTSLNNSTTDFLVDNAAGNYAHLRLLSLACAAGPMEVWFYEAPTTSANGTAITANNCNRVSANTPGVNLYEGPTVSATGTQLTYILAPGARQTGGVGESPVDIEWILAPSTKYLVRVVNLGAGNTIAGLRWFWYEGGA